ncbi:hypothetical protein [Ruegeria sp. SCP11]|uniref:hypothetical protein n=1 Tax=Ruegeria sp. SCP11 TaxID=3141378 RepID=UPI003334C02C
MTRPINIDHFFDEENKFIALPAGRTAAESARVEQTRAHTFLEDAIADDFEHLFRNLKSHLTASNARV